jgi:hypothetical protein
MIGHIQNQGVGKALMNRDRKTLYRVIQHLAIYWQVEMGVAKDTVDEISHNPRRRKKGFCDADRVDSTREWSNVIRCCYRRDDDDAQNQPSMSVYNDRAKLEYLLHR